jgi:hypothetical protein
LNENVIDSLNRLVVIFLEAAQLRVKERKDIVMNFWKENVDRMLVFNDKTVLQNSGSITNKQMEEKVTKVYENFDAKRKFFEANQEDIKELVEIEKSIKPKK